MASTVPIGSGRRVFLSPRTSSLTQDAPGLPSLFENLAPEAGNADRVFGREAPGGVGEDGVAGEVEIFEKRFALLVYRRSRRTATVTTRSPRRRGHRA